MTQEELDKIIEQHQHWLKKDCEGWEDMRADLRFANLESANLRSANLRSANLMSTDLRFANLESANLRSANLESANLESANLMFTNLMSANLESANLESANLMFANLSEEENFRLGKVLDKPLIGYKKTTEGVVITAEIPIGAIVFCINGSKCRTNRAKITDMAGHDVLHSQYDNSFEYRLGQEINIKDFNLMYNVECASGFHFFRTREEAEKY